MYLGHKGEKKTRHYELVCGWRFTGDLHRISIQAYITQAYRQMPDPTLTVVVKSTSLHLVVDMTGQVIRTAIARSDYRAWASWT